jgi:hypothetical protein
MNTTRHPSRTAVDTAVEPTPPPRSSTAVRTAVETPAAPPNLHRTPHANYQGEHHPHDRGGLRWHRTPTAVPSCHRVTAVEWVPLPIGDHSPPRSRTTVGINKIGPGVGFLRGHVEAPSSVARYVVGRAPMTNHDHRARTSSSSTRSVTPGVPPRATAAAGSKGTRRVHERRARSIFSEGPRG